MFGSWKTIVETPFGDEEYIISIHKDGATIHHQTGDVEIDIYSYSDNTFFFQTKLEFPIQCRMLIQGKYHDNKIFGTIQVDTYLKTIFTGELV